MSFPKDNAAESMENSSTSVAIPSGCNSPQSPIVPSTLSDNHKLVLRAMILNPAEVWVTERYVIELIMGYRRAGNKTIKREFAEVFLNDAVKYGWLIKRRASYSIKPEFNKVLAVLRAEIRNHSGKNEIRHAVVSQEKPRKTAETANYATVVKPSGLRVFPETLLNSEHCNETKQVLEPPKISSRRKPIARNFQANPKNAADSNTCAISLFSERDLRSQNKENKKIEEVKEKSKKTTKSLNPRAPAHARPRTSLKTQIAELKTNAKKIASAENNTNQLSIKKEINYARAYTMAVAYEDALAAYYLKPTFKFIKNNFRTDTTSYKRLIAASLLVEELKISPKEYLKAQFYYFDKWFNRAPRIFEIASEKAKARVLMYQSEVRSGNINTRVNTITPVMPTPTIANSQRKQFSKQQLQTLMKNYEISEEDALLRFATKEVAPLFFDKQFLAENHTYLRLKTEGKL